MTSTEKQALLNSFHTDSLTNSRCPMTSTQRAKLGVMNAEIEQLYSEGRDVEALNLEERANAFARRAWRSPMA